MYKRPHHHGNAEYGTWWEIPLSSVSAFISQEEPTIPQGAEEYVQRRYAEYVYVVNSLPVTLSGDLTIDNSNLEALVTETNNLLTDMISGGIVDKAMGKYIEENNNFIWVAESAPGTPLNAPLWRIKQIEETMVGLCEYTRITWAGGSDAYVHVATPPLSANIFS